MRPTAGLFQGADIRQAFLQAAALQTCLWCHRKAVCTFEGCEAIPHVS